MLAQAMSSHNLANANTTGFKSELSALTGTEVVGPGFRSRVLSNHGAGGSDFQEGAVRVTDRELDVAIKGDGWIAVQTRDGGEGYTRAGDLRVAQGGLLVTGSGHPVIGQGGPVAIPNARSVEIGADGTVSVVPADENPAGVVQLDRIKLVNPDPADLAKGADGVMRLEFGGIAPADAAVLLVPGALEGSNVDAVSELVELIAQGRMYEVQIKMMRAARETDTAMTRAMGLGG
jgi:flagellar basal-body rod protein FlgF